MENRQKTQIISMLKEWIIMTQRVLNETQEAITAIQKVQKKCLFDNSEMRLHCRETLNTLFDSLMSYKKDLRRYDKMYRKCES